MKNITITAPKGFWAAGVRSGIKKSGNPDLAMLICPTGARAAAVFTTNKIVSAAVTVSKEHIKSPIVRAVVVNSGNANACTGQTGIRNAITMCVETGGWINAKPKSVLVASTGIIGERLPMKNVIAGIKKAAAELSDSESAGMNFTKAIMTTDTKPKKAVRKLEISGAEITIAGTAKGAGMIAPNMATTLCFLTTDAAISKAMLAKSFKAAINNSLNKLTVDGHQSTNDTAVILASGLANNQPIVTAGSQYNKFAGVLGLVCDDLARQMALDAEGATRMFKVVVKGASSKTDALKACRAVADYPLVKCAVNGDDPNWGRIICAVGSAGVALNQKKLSCKLGDITVFKNGTPRKFDAKKASEVVSQIEHTITVDLGAGHYSDFYYGCDMSTEYVKINADYHT